MAKRVRLEELSREELERYAQSLKKRYQQVKFRHDAALEFFHDMEIMDAYSDWVKMKAKSLGLDI